MSVDRGKAGILVTDAGRGSALAFLRSLGSQGWRVVAGDSDPRSPGFRSRHAHGRLLYPDPVARPRDFAEALAEGVRRLGIELVVPVTDEAILPLARWRQRFADLCTLALPDGEALEAVSDKGATLDLARRLGIPVPRTRRVASISEALEAAPELGWPVVVKPQRSRVLGESGPIECFEVRLANGRTELARHMRGLEGRSAVLLQEYVQGSGVGVELLLDAGRPLAAFQHRRIRELPIRGGRSALRESARLDPELHAASLRLLGAIGFSGLAMVEFRVGPSGAFLMEVNGRVWGSLPLAVQSGMDFPRRLAELYLLGPPGPELPADRHYRLGVRVQSLELELKWIASLLLRPRQPGLVWPPRRQALRALRDLIDPRVGFDVQSLSDPRPGLADLSRILRGALTRLRRRRAGDRG